MRSFFFCSLLTGLCLLACQPAQKPQQQPPRSPFLAQDLIGKTLAKHGVEGVVVMYDRRRDQTITNDSLRARQGFLPASTFKIPNTLIALEAGVVSGPHDTLRWDGVERRVEVWNRDHDLASAFKYSALWYYQALARQVGNEAYLSWLDRFGYGNQLTGPAVDLFWLDGDLRISPREQIDFLERLYLDELPVAPAHLRILKDIMVLEETEAYTLRGKTGWSQPEPVDNGWFVGYLETSDNVYFFALNIDIKQDQDARARVAVVRELLAGFGLMEGV